MYCLLKKTENKQKEAGVGPFKKSLLEPLYRYLDKRDKKINAKTVLQIFLTMAFVEARTTKKFCIFYGGQRPLTGNFFLYLGRWVKYQSATIRKSLSQKRPTAAATINFIFVKLQTIRPQVQKLHPFKTFKTKTLIFCGLGVFLPSHQVVVVAP